LDRSLPAIQPQSKGFKKEELVQAPSSITQLTDHLFRRESGKMVAILTRVFGTENLQLSEDVVQETFITAVQVWSLKGLPANPSAWLMMTAKNKAIDAVRRNKFSSQVDFSDPERKLLQSEYTLVTQVQKLWQENAITDDLLRMMFACCHPGITIENQVTLILKTLCGFSTEEIGKAFITSNDTVSKRLYRTKEFFRNQKIKPEFPDATQLKERTDAVLKAIYLIFNEGYNSTHSDELIRKDLLDQALYLCKLLCDNTYTQLPQVYAAMALMCFHAARIDSRISAGGEIILLAQQDRSKWNRQLIGEGNDYLNKAAYGDAITSYHAEAAIAYEHCIAKTFEETNWKNILGIYDILLAIHPTAVVALNRLTVIYQLKGRDETLEQMNVSPWLKDWKKHYLYYSLLGEIYKSSDPLSAKENYEKAITLTNSEAEQKLLAKKISELK
jgi:RNA polymerase sigma factor (sigma-70 family)